MCAQSGSRDTFDRLASEYDELKLRVIPGYRQVQDLALRYASAHSGQRVLELGCGTGEWASAFLHNHPEADYVAVEFSPNMRDLAATRLAAHRTRLQLLDQDVSASLPEGPFDLVVSFFAIHHVQNKQRRVHDVLTSLASGGMFIYADITLRQIQGSSDYSWTDGSHSYGERGWTRSEFPTCSRIIPNTTSLNFHRRSCRTCERPAFAPAEVIWSWERKLNLIQLATREIAQARARPPQIMRRQAAVRAHRPDRRADVVSDRHLARHRDDSGRPRRSESTGANERRHDVDVRGRAPDKHAVSARRDPLDAPMAHDGDGRIDSAPLQATVRPRRSAPMASSTHREDVEGLSGVSGPRRRRGSRRTSPEQIVSSPRSVAGWC
jgi:ubiquinone/menaquinone biosynthesis C-methylase UbiE